MTDITAASVPAGAGEIPGLPAAGGTGMADAGAGGTDPGEQQRRWEQFEVDDGRMLTASFSARHQSRLQWPVMSFLAGMGLRAAHLPHPLWLVAAATAVMLAGGTAAQELASRRAAEPAEPEWVAELDRYRQWLPHRQPPVPPAVLAAADQHLAAAAASGRWRSAHLVIARRPPEAAWLTMGFTEHRGSRLVFHLGEHVACNPAAAAGTLAHEARHPRGWNRLLSMGTGTGYARGYLIAGWALPWPAAAWAALGVHAALMLAAWIKETGCDLAAASAAGRPAMDVTFDVMTASACQRSSHLPRPRRIKNQALHWAEGPVHPPIPVRRAVVRIWCRLRPAAPRRPPGPAPDSEPGPALPG